MLSATSFRCTGLCPPVALESSQVIDWTSLTSPWISCSKSLVMTELMNMYGQNLKVDTKKNRDFVKMVVFWVKLSSSQFKLPEMSSLKINGYVVLLWNAVKETRTEKRLLPLLVRNDLWWGTWEHNGKRSRAETDNSVALHNFHIDQLATLCESTDSTAKIWASDPTLLKWRSQYCPDCPLNLLLRACYGLNCVSPEFTGWSPNSQLDHIWR